MKGKKQMFNLPEGNRP